MEQTVSQHTRPRRGDILDAQQAADHLGVSESLIRKLWQILGGEARVILDSNPERRTPLDPAEIRSEAPEAVA
jgi:hypothetical protein